jgi:hypothetical protein
MKGGGEDRRVSIQTGELSVLCPLPVLTYLSLRHHDKLHIMLQFQAPTYKMVDLKEIMD